MGILSKLANITSIICSGSGSGEISTPPSELNVWQSIALFFKSLWTKIGDWLVKLLWTIFYYIGKLVLNIVDFLAIAVKEMAGQNQIEDLANVRNATEADMVFKFIFDSNIWRIFIALLGLAAVLLVIFTIIAVIKNEYEAFLGGAEDNSKWQFVKRALTSIFLIIFVPIIAFGGILLSNAVLKSVDNALGRRSGNSTIASEVFIASTYESNAYRQYADKGERIPITFDFKTLKKNELELPSGGQSSDAMNSTMQAYIEKGEWTRGLFTWWLFYNNYFFDFEDVENSNVDALGENGEVSSVSWDSFFDKGLQIGKGDYYVMADVVDYMVRSRKTLYVVNAWDVMNQKEFGVNDETSGMTTPFRKRTTANGEEYYFRVYYNSSLAKYMTGLSFDSGGWYRDFVFNNSTDEANGAVYLMCSGSWVGEGKEAHFVYYPLVNSEKAVNYYSGKFYSEYLGFSQIVIARGCFDENGYPTAIRQNGGKIEFYRNNVEAPSLADFFPQITYESQDGKFNFASIFNNVVEYVTGVDISSFVPKVYVRSDMWNFFTKRTAVAASLDSGEMFVDYNFNAGLKLYNLESIKDINILVLLFGGVLLLYILGSAMFGLIGRIFDLTLLFITYPVFASTMPLDEGKRYKEWTKKFVGKVLGTYGVVIGINLVFILVPAVADMGGFFTESFVSNNIHTWGVISPHSLTVLLNFGVWILFYLVLFTLLKNASSLVSGWIGGEDAVAEGGKIIGDIKNVVDKTTDVVSGKFLVRRAETLAGDVRGFIPGSAFVADARKAMKNRADRNKLGADIAGRKKHMEDGDVGGIDKDLKKSADAKAKAEADKAKEAAKEKKKKASELAKGFLGGKK